MTTTVTVAALHGHAVEVTHIDTNIMGDKIPRVDVVPAGETLQVHVWGGRDVRIREIQATPDKELK